MKNGIYSGISNEAYHGGVGISKSGLDLVSRSPLHYWAAYLDPDREQRQATPAMKLGTAIHTAVLEPGTYRDRYVVMPEGVDRRTKDGKEIYAACEQEAAAKGAEIISASDHEKVMRIYKSCLEHPLTKKVFETGEAEVSAYWTDAETGVLCKCRPDWLLGGENPAILDLKSTENASPDEFIRSAFSWRYHVAAAWYLDGVEQAMGVKPDAFMFLAVEKTAPFAAAYYYADDDMLTAGRAEYRRALRTYADCLSSDKWPGYEPRLQPLGLPRWANVQLDVEQGKI